MKIERTDNETLIRVSADTDITGLQRILDTIKFREIASKSKVTQEKIDALSSKSKSTWWESNKSRFIGTLNSFTTTDFSGFDVSLEENLL